MPNYSWQNDPINSPRGPDLWRAILLNAGVILALYLFIRFMGEP